MPNGDSKNKPDVFDFLILCGQLPKTVILRKAVNNYQGNKIFTAYEQIVNYCTMAIMESSPIRDIGESVIWRVPKSNTSFSGFSSLITTH